MAEPRSITAEQFTEEVGGEKLSIVEFWMHGCPACARFEPIFAALAEEMGEGADCLTVEARENMDLARSLQIHGVPTVIVYRGGQEVQRSTGVKTLEQIREWLSPASG